MTDRELRKLRRSELLAMMIEQKKAVAEAQEALAEEQRLHEETRGELAQLQETYERLRKKLDDKDEKIHELQADIAREQEKTKAAYGETETIAAVTERLNKAVAAAERAAALYEYTYKSLRAK